jgi:hypothetical protein
MLASVSSSYTDAATTVFSSVIAAKAWFTTFAIVFAVVQVLTGARIFGHLQRFVPIGRPRVNRVHRWSGRLAILCTLPVAFQCITVLGFRHTDTRVLVHSIAGSLLYGVVAVKLFFVHDSDHPRWTLPLVGGTLFAVLVTLWGTGSVWYFTQVRFGF